MVNDKPLKGIHLCNPNPTHLQTEHLEWITIHYTFDILWQNGNITYVQQFALLNFEIL